MRRLFHNITFVLLICWIMPVASQSNANTSRSPEQEALKQTEKLQTELSLSPEQFRQIYEINLRYARMRQVSNTRDEALERVKNKNIEIQNVLNPTQKNQLDSKRYSKTYIKEQLEKTNKPNPEKKNVIPPTNVPSSPENTTTNAASGNKKQGSPPTPEYQPTYVNGPKNGSETKLPSEEPAQKKRLPASPPLKK